MLSLRLLPQPIDESPQVDPRWVGMQKPIQNPWCKGRGINSKYCTYCLVLSPKKKRSEDLFKLAILNRAYSPFSIFSFNPANASKSPRVDFSFPLLIALTASSVFEPVLAFLAPFAGLAAGAGASCVSSNVRV